ncbi:MAG: hypothetical protein ABFS35_17835 [Bacteroidota bacterium]
MENIVDFIKNKRGGESLSLASKQQNQISYFTQSSIQKEINIEYLKQWANRKYLSDDYFLNWVKAVFKTDNFLTFFKYFRQPLASARLVNSKIKDPLSRVFFAEDSYFKYEINGKDVIEPDELKTDAFNDKIFKTLLFNHNDILIHDLNGVNKPFREMISIHNVKAIESKDSVITRIGYSAVVMIDGEKKKGYIYMDAERYVFVDKDFEELLNIPHDLGVCPADYVAKDAFSDDDVVRKSIFSYAVEEFEEYVFLKTLQRMTEPNGAIPIVTQLDVKTKKKEGVDTANNDPMSSIGGQQSDVKSEAIGTGNDSPLQAGSRIKVPMIRKEDNSLDMDAVTNFLRFFYVPIEALNYLNKRIEEIEKDIIITLLGDYSEENEASKNEMQVSKSYQNKQDKLRSLALQMTRIRNLSDYKMLGLQHGKDSVIVDGFYGSDFFIETTTDLYKLYQNSPNAIERRNILMRLAQNRNKFNPNKADREKIMYNLMPYASDIDFDKAIDRGLDDVTFHYQTRFNYWISLFEASYGDILFFWKLLGGSESENLSAINNLIINNIKDYVKQSGSTPTSVQE